MQDRGQTISAHVGDTVHGDDGIPAGLEPEEMWVDRLGALSAPTWLSPTELRIGLGCMRLSTGGDIGEDQAVATIVAAVGAGVTVFDTARAYEGNEQLLARALRRCDAGVRARIITKGGMSRPGGAWVPDGRAGSIRRDCDASLTDLDGLPIDLYLLHAPDPRTPWETSVRALARLIEAGLVGRVGLSNVTRAQLDQALHLAPITAVQFALNVVDDTALRSGLLQQCEELGITVIAHSPLGGPSRIRRVLTREPALTRVAQRHGVGAAEVALAWLLGLSPRLVAVPGARRPDAVHSAARAARLRLDEQDGAVLDRRFGRRRPPGAARRDPAPDGAEVVLVMGIPGAGKTRATAGLLDRGYLRLNRDERGGSLRDLADELDRALDLDPGRSGRRVVLDNTYLTRAARSHVVDVAARYQVPVRCLWLDTPLEQAQINLVLRLLDRFGHLPMPHELADQGRREPGLLTPTSHLRAYRQLETPSDDEGFAGVERVPFVRAQGPAGRPVVFVAASAVDSPGWQETVATGHPAAPHLIFDWRPDDDLAGLTEVATQVVAEVTGPVELTACPHPGGPPRCWCRPPLPGLPLAFARRHDAALAASVLIGTGPTHRRMATALGTRYVTSRSPGSDGAQP